jgi:hypothetical protein
MQAKFVVSHAKYTGSTDSDGYPTGDAYGTPADRLVFGWYPLSSQLSPAGEYDRRVVTSKVVLVPDPTVFSPRDQVVLPGADDVSERTYFVSEDMRDYTTGPFGYRPGGEIVLEKVSG